MSAVSVRATLGTCRHADMCRHVRFETLTREFGVVVMVAMTLTLAGRPPTLSAGKNGTYAKVSRRGFMGA